MRYKIFIALILMVFGVSSNLWAIDDKVAMRDGASTLVGNLTKLRIASKTGDTKTAKLLIEKRANVNPRTKAGETALKLVIKNNHAQIINLLKKAGATE